MKKGSILGISMALMAILLLTARPKPVEAGMGVTGSDYKVLAPISHGDLTIFPIVASKVHDASDFLTLDEGIRSGDVVVTEVGNIHPMIRRRTTVIPPQGSGGVVNRLVLVNNSKHPLILLAGEVVTGGKQDRVVGKDRIVPAESDPIDLSVFCVEHGRWVESSAKFDTHAYVMAQPSVRKQAMVANNQQKVWDEVASSKAAMAANSRAKLSSGASSTVAVESSPPMAELRKLDSTTSYAKTRENKVIQQQVDDIVQPMQKSYESVIKQLREQNAVGVVVAVKGHIIWADMFASTGLLSKYWPKLLQSYAAEALSMPGERIEITSKSAQQFLDNWQTTHEVIESEPGLYRQTEMTGDRFKAFELTSLLPKQNFDVHLSKIVN
ncbi:MAG TPA: DUF6569 family protein [Candidatus Angelobacter sp.]|jgi:hypothetical protein|nr:DUF6569 family protein [Candidatus Angelobacter sp.]